MSEPIAPMSPLETNALQSARMEPTLSGLPAELKALVVNAVAALDQQRYDAFNERNLGHVDEYSAPRLRAAAQNGWNVAATRVDNNDGGDTAEAEWTTDAGTSQASSDGVSRCGSDGDDADAFNDDAYARGHKFISTLSTLALVSHEWAELCRPALWRQLDLSRETDKLVELIQGPLLRYGTLVESLVGLVQEDDVDVDEARELELQAGHCAQVATVEQLARQHGINLEDVNTTERAARIRSLAMAIVVDMCSNLSALEMTVRESLQSEFNIRPRDYVFRVVQTKFRCQLTEFSVTADSDGAWDYFSFTLDGFEALKALSLDFFAPGDLGHVLVHDIAYLPSLTSLNVASGAYFDDNIVNIKWTNSLEKLTLSGCDELSYRSWVAFLEMHPTLVQLDLDDVPVNMTDTDRDTARCLNLPRLSSLAISTVLNDFLNHFTDSPIREFELNFAPSIDQRQIEAFIATHEQTLERLLLTDVDQFTDAQLESLELLCHSKNIEFEYEPATDSEDNEDGSGEYWNEFDDDDSEEWSSDYDRD
ncbi:hypothetical protein OIV83_000627 [Microbotryomycetes sp. JL201]|nr:hypothetical protein OIV83_000627 [Microbotryomycetes sp. JL201]